MQPQSGRLGIFHFDRHIESPVSQFEEPLTHLVSLQNLQSRSHGNKSAVSFPVQIIQLRVQ